MSTELLKLANASGFALQLALEEQVRLGLLKHTHPWNIESREHGWRDGDTPRFIDLVLSHGAMYLVIECKRTRGADWVFLVPDPPTGRRAMPRRHFRAQYLRKEESHRGPQPVTSLQDFQLEPAAWESAFCAIRGSSENDKPMLDRLCAEVTRSSDALLEQQMTVGGGFHPAQRWIAVPVIVTTAKLHVCRFDPGTISLADGMIPETTPGLWEPVPAVRYRKSFDTIPSPSTQSVGDVEKHSQRSVAIVTADHFLAWLEGFDLKMASYAGLS